MTHVTEQWSSQDAPPESRQVEQSARGTEKLPSRLHQRRVRPVTYDPGVGKEGEPDAGTRAGELHVRARPIALTGNPPSLSRRSSVPGASPPPTSCLNTAPVRPSVWPAGTP